MKYLSKLILCTGIASIFVVGCDTNELHNLNVNPQAVSQINLNFMFTPAQLASAAGGGSGDNRYTDWRTNIGMCSYAIQQLANGGLGGIAPGDRYTDNFETAEAPFQFFLGDELLKTAEIIKQTSDKGYDAGNKQNLKSAARILRAFLFARLTDYYGSVPYSEAEKAADQIFFPKYDKQKDIYTDLLKELHEACLDLTAGLAANRADEGFGAADLYYNGDITKWKKWGYSLMLRFAMKISTVDPATAGPYITEAIAGGVFTSNADNVWCPMATGPSQWTNQNGISRAFYPGDGGQPIFLSKTLVNWLKGPNAASTADDDPRLMIISGGIGAWSVVNGKSTWTPTATGTDPLNQRGMPNGMNASLLLSQDGVSNPDISYSKMNIKMLDLDDPYLLMNYGEVELLLAEAAERGLGGATGALTHYANGVKASMHMYTPYDASLDVAAGVDDAYLAAHPYVAGTTGLTMIGEQLWANHFLNWYEAWGDWRRTSIPVLTPVNYPGNVTGGTIPQRLKYPNREVSGNPNFDATSTKPNLYTTKVWWAGGPE